MDEMGGAQVSKIRGFRVARFRRLGRLRRLTAKAKAVALDWY
jgi:hypothetical protein